MMRAPHEHTPRPSPPDGPVTQPRALRRWASLAALALLTHAALLSSFSWWASDPTTIKVLGVSPVPGMPFHLSQSDQVEVAITLSPTAQDAPLNPLGARLLYMDDPRGPQVVATATRDPDDPTKLWLRAPARLGTFRVWLAAGGVEPLFSGAFALDGELTTALPSGNGEPGGDFIYAIEVLTAPPEPEEMLLATLIEEEEPPEESSSASSALTPSTTPTPPPSPPDLTPPTPPTPTPPIPQPKTTAKPRPTPPKPSPSPPQSVEPPPTPSPDSTEPAPIIPAQDLVRLNPLLIEDLIGEQAALAGDALDQQARESGLLGDWQGRLDDVKSAFSGEGPAAQPGNQQAVSTHTPEISAYLAMIHRRIHNQWADGYLISLDLMQRDMGSPLNNPNLETVVELEISPNGKVTKVRLVKTSGVSQYDAEAVRTARSSGPEQPTPRQMRSPDGNAYVHWSFWRDQRQCGAFGANVYVLDGKGLRNKVKIDESKLQQEEAKLGLPTGRPQPHSHSLDPSLDPSHLPKPPPRPNRDPKPAPKPADPNQPPSPSDPTPPKPQTPAIIPPRKRPPRPPRPPLPGLEGR
jgi:TonB family protein